MTDHDPVHHPSHYEQGGIEFIDYVTANDMDFLEGSIIKYIHRYKFKGGIQDLEKANQYLAWLIQRELKKKNP